MAKAQPAAYSREAWEAIRDSMPEADRERHPVLATLYAEHRYMATLAKLLSEQLDLLETGEGVDGHILYEAMHYMTHYPDAFHHPREDMVYQRAGELDANILDSVDTLQRDHDYLCELGNSALDSVSRWREGAEVSDKVIQLGKEYIGSLYRHMSTEEKLVFPQIEALLKENDWLELEQEDLLSPVSDPVFGPRVGREYRKLARKARRALRRGVEDAAVAEWIGLEAMLEGLEVLSMAIDNSKAAAKEQLDAALEETRDMILEVREEPAGALTLPMRCMLNNTGRYFNFLRELGTISKDAAGDLAELNRGVRSRMRMVVGDAPTVEKKPGAKSASRKKDGQTVH